MRKKVGLYTALAWLVDLVHYPLIGAIVIGNLAILHPELSPVGVCRILLACLITRLVVLLGRDAFSGRCPLSLLSRWLYRRENPRYAGKGYAIYLKPLSAAGIISLLLMSGLLAIPYYVTLRFLLGPICSPGP